MVGRDFWCEDKSAFDNRFPVRTTVLNDVDGAQTGCKGAGMEFGLYGLHRGGSTDPALLARRAHAAEAAGFESLWVGDHVVG